MFTAVVPISRDRHAGRGWHRFRSYGFAAGTILVPLAGAELARAVHAFPVAFLREGARFVLVAVLGIEPGRNVFVTADGRWVASYIPARLRGYPFVEARTEDGRTVIAIDEDSGLLTGPGDGPGDGQGTPLFDDEGGLSPTLRGVADFLRKLEQSRSATQAAVDALAAAGAIAPWSFNTMVGGAPRSVTGLFTVDEAVLQGLADEAFLALRRHGSLAVAYAQLLSKSHVDLLGRLAGAHAERDTLLQRRLAGSFVDEPADDLSFDFG